MKIDTEDSFCTLNKISSIHCFDHALVKVVGYLDMQMANKKVDQLAGPAS